MATEIQISGETATVVPSQGSIPPPDLSAPLIRFPPFPEIPEGVSIIPFSQFRPKGIRKRLVPDADHPDLDGHGRPTAKLKVAHASTSSEKWKKKKRRLGEGDDGVVRKFVWYEEWAKDEDNRKTSVEHSIPLTDRLIQAAADFKERPWGNINFRLNETFDAFRVYVGLLSCQPTASTSGDAKDASDDDDDDDEDLEEEMAAYNPIPDPLRASEDSYPYTEPSEPERRQETKEERAMRAFLTNPERSLKIFFTSYFIDKGLMWKESRCVDAPELVRFFVSFLIRNNVYSDVPLNGKLKNCLKLLETARKELPATFAISKALDDPFSNGCSTHWGRTIQSIDLGEDYAQPPVPQEVEELEKAIIDHDKITSCEGTWADVNEAIEIEGGDDTNSWGTWGQPQTGDGGGGWGSSAAEGAWGSTGNENPNDSQSGWEVEPLPTLADLLGPTNLPQTHTTGIFESSMRRIVDLIPPSPAVETEDTTPGSPASEEERLYRRFGKVVLGPWIGWDCGKEANLDKPTILSRSRAPVKTEGEGDQAVGGAHDPYKDNITVLIEPSSLATMIIGIGVAGTWVQITRADADGNPVGGGRDMWYMESVTQVIPSFYLA